MELELEFQEHDGDGSREWRESGESTSLRCTDEYFDDAMSVSTAMSPSLCAKRMRSSPPGSPRKRQKHAAASGTTIDIKRSRSVSFARGIAVSRTTSCPTIYLAPCAALVDRV